MFKNQLRGIGMSLVELIVGILLLIDPIGFTGGIIVALGVVLMVTGLFHVIRYFRKEPLEAAVSRTLAKGLMELLGGGFCVFRSHWFLATFPVLTLVYGVVILVAGLYKLQWMVDSIRLKRGGWLLAAFSAALSLVCGILILLNPFGSTGIIWTVIAVSLIVEALIDVITTFVGKKKAEE